MQFVTFLKSLMCVCRKILEMPRRSNVRTHNTPYKSRARVFPKPIPLSGATEGHCGAGGAVRGVSGYYDCLDRAGR